MAKRTYVPKNIKKLLGERIRNALREEHLQHLARTGRTGRFTVERFCTKTHIPPATLAEYMQGVTVPGVVDMREIVEFTGKPFEWFMDVIPRRPKLIELYAQELKARDEEEA